MTHQELYEHLTDKTGEDIDVIERLGFELYDPQPDLAVS